MLVVVCLLLISSYGSVPAAVAASTEYCVTVTEESACPCNVTCHSLDHYLASPGDYFKSGVMFRFLPGEHHVHETFSGSGIEGLSFVKDEIGGSNVTVLLTMSNYCIPRKYNVPLIITNLTSALNSLKFLDVNVLRYAHAHVRHVKNRYHKGTLKWQD